MLAGVGMIDVDVNVNCRVDQMMQPAADGCGMPVGASAPST